MCKRLICFPQSKIVPLGFIISLLLSIVLTAVEVKFYNLSNYEEIILFFVLTFLFVIFIFLLLAKIYKLSQEKIEPNQIEKRDDA